MGKQAQTSRVILRWSEHVPASDVLPSIKDRLNGTINKLSLEEPSKMEVMKAMDEYNMFSPSEVAEFGKEINS